MLAFIKHDNINAKTHSNISGLHLNSKAVLLFNENFVNLLNSPHYEYRQMEQNSEGNRTVNIGVSEDSVAIDNEIDGFTKVGLLRKKHIKNLFFDHLNINSLRNKREFLEPLIRDHFDIFLVSEIKLDSSFPGFSSYTLFRKGRNQHGGGLIFYVNQDIPCKTINTFNFPNSLEVLPLVINLRNKKILVIGCYKLSSLNDEYFLNQLHCVLCFYSTTYDNFLLLGDFNISCDDERLEEFCNFFSLGHLIKTPTCYMRANSSFIGHIIANMTSLFMKLAL